MRSPRARIRIPLLLIPTAVVAIAQPTRSAEAAPKAPTVVRERVESLEIDIEGKGGVLVTEPEFLEGTGGTYRFGSACGAPIGNPVLEQLLAAVGNRTLVTVKTNKRVEDGLPCLQSVVFYAP